MRAKLDIFARATEDLWKVRASPTLMQLEFAGVCQVPKHFDKEKISSSPSVWHF
jgi:hypothetical protein